MWEYKFEWNASEYQLNMLGQQGWNLVAVTFELRPSYSQLPEKEAKYILKRWKGQRTTW